VGSLFYLTHLSLPAYVPGLITERALKGAKPGWARTWLWFFSFHDGWRSHCHSKWLVTQWLYLYSVSHAILQRP